MISRPPRVPRRPAYRALVLVLVLGFVLLGWAATDAGSALVVRQPVSHPDAIISLASHEWERLPLAARLASASPGAVLLLTEPEKVTPRNCHDCAHRVDRLRLLGVPETRVRTLPVTSPGTHGEALAALAFAQHARIRSLLIATSPYHTRRALAVFGKVFEGTGVKVGIEPATGYSPAEPDRWWMGGYDRAYVAYEWAAIVYYAWTYGVPTALL